MVRVGNVKAKGIGKGSNFHVIHSPFYPYPHHLPLPLPLPLGVKSDCSLWPNRDACVQPSGFVHWYFRWNNVYLATGGWVLCVNWAMLVMICAFVGPVASGAGVCGQMHSFGGIRPFCTFICTFYCCSEPVTTHVYWHAYHSCLCALHSVL